MTRAKRRARTIALAAAVASGVAWPVQGYFQAHSFFHASEKYREWFQNTVWLENTRAAETRMGIRRADIATATGIKYPYKEQKFVMTEAKWHDSSTAVEKGDADWYDIEIVRQRAEMDEHPPAMDFLAWMYENGHGVDRDFRKAFMWYERAKLAGEPKIRGTPAKIFTRLSPQEKFMAQVQLAEDIERAKKSPKGRYQGFDTVKLRVLEQQRESLQTDGGQPAAASAKVRNYR
ncbi:MAG: SEL1-like repeat protein [Rhodospirillales bacterium]|nr:SEL1-like repeat protein [Rhodospirillales bacterium]